MDDRAVTADLYCFVCLDRWMRVSSNDFTRARASTMCRCPAPAAGAVAL